MTHRLIVAAIAACFASSSFAAPGVAVQQGGVARWTDMAAETCGFQGKRYPAVDATCYYAVDIKAKAGRHEIALIDQDGKQHLGWLDVEATEFPEIEITLDDDTYVKPSAENLKRHAEERTRVLALFKGDYDEPKFSLPLAKPAGAMPGSEDDFGSNRTFNGERKSQHTGRDFPVGAGQPVKAVADGTVVLAEEQFFTGNTVFVDHGGGLISMNFHLGSLDVKAGDEIERGKVLGKVGSTGRSTGPHLHLGFRYVGARIDPLLLLDSPNKLPTVGDSPATAEKKIENATEKEPAEAGMEEE